MILHGSLQCLESHSLEVHCFDKLAILIIGVQRRPSVGVLSDCWSFCVRVLSRKRNEIIEMAHRVVEKAI